MAKGRSQWKHMLAKTKVLVSVVRAFFCDLVFEEKNKQTILDTWKHKTSQSQPRKIKESGSSLKSQGKLPTPMDSDSEVEEAAVPKPRGSRAKAQTLHATSSKAAGSTRKTQTRPAKKSQPLFMESDEDDEGATVDADTREGSQAIVDGGNDDENSQPASLTLPSNARTQQSRSKLGSKKKDVPVLMEDSDDDMAFKGFGSKRKGRK